MCNGNWRTVASVSLYHIVHIHVCYSLALFRRVKYVIIAFPTIAQTTTIKMDLITFHAEFGNR